MEANFRPGTGGGWVTPQPISGASSPAAGAIPTVTREPNTGEQWVYYTATSGQIMEANFQVSAGRWVTPEPISGSSGASTGSSPTAIRDEGTSEQWVYYTGTSGQVMEANFKVGAGGGWQAPVGISGSSPAAAGTTPAEIREPSSHEQWVYYIASSGPIMEANFLPTAPPPSWQAPVPISGSSTAVPITAFLGSVTGSGRADAMRMLRAGDGRTSGGTLDRTLVDAPFGCLPGYRSSMPRDVKGTSGRSAVDVTAKVPRAVRWSR